MIHEPVFIYADDGMSIFRTRETAERFMEPVDIRNGVYKTDYDASGKVLHIGIDPAGFYGALTEPDQSVYKDEELASHLRNDLKYISQLRSVPFNPEMLSVMKLSELVELGLLYAIR